MEDLLSQLGTVIQNWQTLGALAGLVALVNLLVRLTKLPALDKYVKSAWRPWLALGLGTIGGLLAALGEGKGFASAAVAGVIAGLSSIGTNQLLGTVTPGGQAKAAAAKAVSDALDGPEAEVRAKVDVMKADLDKVVEMSDKKQRLQALAKMAKNGAH